MENINIIGQKKLLQRIQQLIDSDRYPRFSIIVGAKGSGKKKIARLLCKEISGGLYEECGTKIDDVRELIHDAYQIHSTAVYFIPDADNMSVAAKNALLKVTEEPPNNSYFIMTLESAKNTPETILSRATVFYMDPYKPDEILEYAHKIRKDYDKDKCSMEDEIIQMICETPGDVDIMTKHGVINFYEYVKLVVNNITEVSLANAFKIPSKVALKDADEGYDLRLFLKVFVYTIIKEKVWNGADEDITKSTAVSVLVTSKALQDLKRIRGINKQMLMDKWIMEIREAWT